MTPTDPCPCCKRDLPSVDDDGLCQSCHDDEQDRRSEAAYEAMISDYYGGSTPRNDRERAEVAARDAWRTR